MTGLLGLMQGVFAMAHLRSIDTKGTMTSSLRPLSPHQELLDPWGLLVVLGFGRSPVRGKLLTQNCNCEF